MQVKFARIRYGFYSTAFHIYKNNLVAVDTNFVVNLTSFATTNKLMGEEVH